MQRVCVVVVVGGGAHRATADVLPAHAFVRLDFSLEIYTELSI